MILVLSGPSGVGKDTVLDWIVNHSAFTRFPAYTTRPPRMGEVDGVHYRFVGSDVFASLFAQHEFLDHIEVGGYQYGTPLEDFAAVIARGEMAALHLAAGTALLLKHKLPNVIVVFLMPPSRDELILRLRKRGLDEEAIAKRTREDPTDLKLALDCDFIVVNYHEEVSEAAQRILGYIRRRKEVR